MTETRTQKPQTAPKPRREIDAKLRARIENAVEKMIAALDSLDTPTQDDEDGGDEEDTGDSEPSLGSIEVTEPDWKNKLAFDQTGWARGNSQDLEGDPNEDDEDGHDLEDDPAEMGIGDSGGLNTDDEPSLGWCMREDGGPGALGGTNDAEADLGTYDQMLNQELAAQTPRGDWHAGEEQDAPDVTKADAARRRVKPSMRPANGSDCVLVEITHDNRGRIVEVKAR